MGTHNGGCWRVAASSWTNPSQVGAHGSPASSSCGNFCAGDSWVLGGGGKEGWLWFAVSGAFSYVSSSGLSWKESRSDTASVLTQHCCSWTDFSALCTAKFHPVSITSTCSCKIYCRSSESSMSLTCSHLWCQPPVTSPTGPQGSLPTDQAL